MTVMVLIIGGYRYLGKFEIEDHSASGTDMVDTEVGRHSENWKRSWFEGRGAVTDLRTGIRERFLFCPKGQYEESVILLPEGAHIDRKIRDYSSEAIDKALGSMYESARNSDAVIPTVSLPRLNPEDTILATISLLGSNM